MIKKIIVSLIAIILLVEIVAAPFEWLWPAPWGGNTHWSGEGRWNGPAVNGSNRVAKKQIALTFDDGPSSYTSAVLDILSQYDVPATFFVMGQEVERYPEVFKRAVNEGHEIGNHTYNWVAQKNIFFSAIDVSQIKKNSDVIESYGAPRPKFYRSPGGQAGRLLYGAIQDESLEVVNGIFPMPHPKLNAEEQLEIALTTIEPGAIIILHDGDDHNPDSDRPKATVELLPNLIETIHAQGYQLVTVSGLLGK